MLKALRKVAPWLRLAVSVSLLWLVVQHASVEALMGSFRTVADRWPYLLLGFVPLAFVVVTSVWRWQVLLLSLGPPPKWSFLFRAMLVGSFFNQFLPSTIGGDLVRGWWLRDNLKSGTLSIAVVGVDRFFGLLGLCAVGLIAAAIQPDAVRRLPQFWIAMGVVALGCFSLWLLTRQIVVQLARRALSLRILHSVQEKAMFAYRGLKIVAQARTSLAGAFALALVVQIFITMQYVLMSRVLGLSLSVWELSIIAPVVTLLTWLPVSINGFGVREVSLVSLCGVFGVAPADAVALGWLFLLFTLPPALIGGAIYVLGRRDRAGAAAARLSSEARDLGSTS